MGHPVEVSAFQSCSHLFQFSVFVNFYILVIIFWHYSIRYHSLFYFIRGEILDIKCLPQAMYNNSDTRYSYNFLYSFNSMALGDIGVSSREYVQPNGLWGLFQTQLACCTHHTTPVKWYDIFMQHLYPKHHFNVFRDTGY